MWAKHEKIKYEELTSDLDHLVSEVKQMDQQMTYIKNANIRAPKRRIYMQFGNNTS